MLWRAFDFYAAGVFGDIFGGFGWFWVIFEVLDQEGLGG